MKLKRKKQHSKAPRFCVGMLLLSIFCTEAFSGDQEIIVPLGEYVVTGAHSVYQKPTMQNVTLDKKQVEVLPHLGNDLYHVMGYLPGVVSNDQSASFSVRGSLPREVLVLFDGIELYEPFHMKDFQGVFSIIDPEVVDSLELTTGGFTSEFGDRSAGLMEIKSVNPTEARHSIGASLTSSWFNSAGTCLDDKGKWVFSARRGYLDLVMDIASPGEDENGDGKEDTDPAPEYWDIYGKFSYQINPSHEISFNFLTSYDDLAWDETEEGEIIDMDTNYGNSYAWFRHQGYFGSKLKSDTTISVGQVDRDRDIFLEEYGEISDVKDIRKVNLWGVRQNWQYDWSDRQFLKWGFEFEKYKAKYDYKNSFDFAVTIPDERFLPSIGNYEYNNTFDDERYALYLSDRVRLTDRLVTELGLRFDRHDITDDDLVSPRFNTVYDLEEDGRIHFGLGHYNQSHRPHELDVHDRETMFHEAEKAEQVNIGYERKLFGNYDFRIDSYVRRIGNPRPRYENILDPFNDENPEASPDRVRLDIESTTAKGVEILVAQKTHPKLNWSLSYTFSSVEDKINGENFNRSIDQPHSLIAAMTYKKSENWDITAVWNYHTGWPRTEISAEYMEMEDGSRKAVPVVGKFYDERHDAYHRLDLRSSYRKELTNSLLTFFVDIQNIYNRRNVRGHIVDEDSFVYNTDGSVSVNPKEEKWLGVIPSFGIKWEF